MRKKEIPVRFYPDNMAILKQVVEATEGKSLSSFIANAAMEKARYEYAKLKQQEAV